MSRIVVLIGMMGSGKTTVGKRLAQRMDSEFVDTDDLVVAVAGKSVRDIFTEDGEAAFRALEEGALAAALASSRDTVVAAAGGCVLSDANRTAVASRADMVVWLDADLTALTSRVQRGVHRPLVDGDAATRLAELDEQRRALYERLATLHIDTSELSVDEVVDIVSAEIEARP